MSERESEKSTTERGNEFRSEVFGLLEAAGFTGHQETRIDFKKVDVESVWARDEFEGEIRYLFEAKDHSGTLSKDECAKFVAEYGTLIDQDKADRAWLVSRGDISPDGRALIDAKRDLSCFTFYEFKRQLFRLEAYLRNLIAEYESKRISEFFVHPVTEEHGELEHYVVDWLDKDREFPLAVVGGYGTGKTTFALHLAAVLAKEALSNSMARAPILVPLGEIFDEQSVDGLISKVLASKNRVGNYHYHLFQELNSAGQFVIIFDGFDEMKHGMTLSRFERIIDELMTLDDGRAKILLLGRDTAFHDDEEFRSVILGQRTTSSGRTVRAPDRRPCLYVTLRGFSVEESQSYVRRYFPIYVSNVMRSASSVDADWVRSRVSELTDGRFDELLKRPVHAEMLCKIASDPDVKLESLSKFELYDTFLHYLLDREVKKTSRYQPFTVLVRRRFNMMVAWWLWEQGGASTTTLSDIPERFFEDTTIGIEHEFDAYGLQKELTAGCLVVKGQDTIYFGHRSIQEFLVSEYLYHENLLDTRNIGRGDLNKVFRSINAEIIDFLIGRLNTGDGVSAQDTERISAWLTYLDSYRSTNVAFQGFELYRQLLDLVPTTRASSWSNPWRIWLRFFCANGRVSFQIQSEEATGVLAEIMEEFSTKDNSQQAAALLLVSRVLSANRDRIRALLPKFIASWLPRGKLKDVMHESRQTSQSVYVRRNESLPLWAFLISSEVLSGSDRIRQVQIDLERLEAHMVSTLDCNLEGEPIQRVGQPLRGDSKFACPLQSVYREMEIPAEELDRIRPYFGDQRLRSRIRPLIVEHAPKSRRGDS